MSEGRDGGGAKGRGEGGAKGFGGGASQLIKIPKEKKNYFRCWYALDDDFENTETPIMSISNFPFKTWHKQEKNAL